MVQTCIFDLYGTLVDIHTDEEKPEVWKKLALFFRYYGADYTPAELKEAYSFQVQKLTEMFREELEKENGKDSAGKHSPEYESSPEIQMEEVFLRLYRERGVEADQTLAVHTGQFFRSLSTDYLRLYDGVESMLSELRQAGKKVYLHTNLSPEEIVTEADAVIEGADMERLKELLLGSSGSNKEKVTEKESNKRENRKNLQKSKEKRKQP